VCWRTYRRNTHTIVSIIIVTDRKIATSRIVTEDASFRKASRKRSWSNFISLFYLFILVKIEHPVANARIIRINGKFSGSVTNYANNHDYSSWCLLHYLASIAIRKSEMIQSYRPYLIYLAEEWIIIPIQVYPFLPVSQLRCTAVCRILTRAFVPMLNFDIKTLSCHYGYNMLWLNR